MLQVFSEKRDLHYFDVNHLCCIESIEEATSATGGMGDGEGESAGNDDDGEVLGSKERWISGVLGAVGATVGLLLLITAVLTVLLCVWQCYKRGIFSTIIYCQHNTKSVFTFLYLQSIKEIQKSSQ